MAKKYANLKDNERDDELTLIRKKLFNAVIVYKNSHRFSPKRPIFDSFNEILQENQNDHLIVLKKLNSEIDKSLNELLLHTSSRLTRYALTALSIITVVPAIVKIALSFYYYKTLQFWRPESMKFALYAKRLLSPLSNFFAQAPEAAAGSSQVIIAKNLDTTTKASNAPASKKQKKIRSQRHLENSKIEKILPVPKSGDLSAQIANLCLQYRKLNDTEQLNLLEDFFSNLKHSDEKSAAINLMLKLAMKDTTQKMLCSILGGKIPSFIPTKFSYIAAHFYSDSLDKIFNEDKSPFYDDIDAPVLNFSVETQFKIMNKVIDVITAKIFDTIEYDESNKMLRTFYSRLVRWKQGSYFNRDRTSAEELKNIITEFSSSLSQCYEKVPLLLEELYQFCYAKEKNAAIHDFENKQQIAYHREMQDSETRKDNVRTFYYLVNMGKITSISQDYLLELFPLEAKQNIQQLTARIQSLGCDIKLPDTKIRLKSTMGS